MANPTPSINQQMLNTAAQATRLFDEDTVELIRQFVLSQQNPDGGFRGRSSESDLYYTLFAIECLQALQYQNFDKVKIYIQSFIDNDNLDFVHTACLIRSLARLSMLEVNLTQALLIRLNQYKTPEGLFRMETEQPSIYGNFLGIAAYEACSASFEQPDLLISMIQNLKTPDGAYADGPGMDMGTTTVTAAAVILLSHLHADNPNPAIEWLIARKNQSGGFVATTHAPLPDLLSTATTLFALKITGHSQKTIDESTQNFIESVWTDSGGFCGTIFDPEPDVEYTFYGLLAAGVHAECIGQ